MKTVLALSDTRPGEQLLFLGSPIGLQRYDSPKHPIFLELTDRQGDYFWRPKEIDFSRDRATYGRLQPQEQQVFAKNLRFQIAGDSMLSRSICQLLPHCTNTALESAMTAWAYFETIHSRSYTYSLDAFTQNSSEFYDSVLEDQEIVQRMAALRSRFDTLLGTNQSLTGAGAPKGDSLRQALFNAILAAQIMEGVTFYVSFACSFYFDKRGSMTGNGGIIKLISRDENLHVAITQNILRIWRDFPEEGFQDIVRASKELVLEAYRLGVDAEKSWASYLFQDGALVGLTAQSLGAFAEWMANNRLASQGFERIFPAQTNPFAGWIQPYFSSQETAVAPQETEITAYLRTVQRGTTASENDWDSD